MDPSSAGSVPGSTGPPDRQILQLLERQLASDGLVAETEYDPDPYEPHLVRASLDIRRYPRSVTAARIDIRWFTTDDFSLHYRESREDSQWECRWDRHPNTHNSRLHFHEPPTGEEISDLELPSLHPLDVYSTVFETLEHRLETLW
ncbi:hypothetical protein [Halanaeroarchaeum sulfurireducens]|uniref:Uncharacterized protein n=1 Tax=Halanaeroarchaeum sulfurireducens TaxID=1604004 RepID=A0A0F7PB66_9EURY|nr:hypothetical protein HLASF_0903 [Halanaeroarchaeum sulfurireducens]ALG81797.1 hypothetical protein HLASA_0900 [Halanaeroarchaeum sulfurireducens]